MKNSRQHLTTNLRKVFALLEMQSRALKMAGSSSDMQEAFNLVLQYLKRASPSQILELSNSELDRQKVFSKRLVGDFDVDSMSLDDIERVVSNEDTPRRILEKIAISRFHVPKGSMRSFQNVGMLREKILIRVQNERTHETIGQIAGSPRDQN